MKNKNASCKAFEQVDQQGTYQTFGLESIWTGVEWSADVIDEVYLNCSISP